MLENKLNHLAVIMDGNRRWAKLNDLDFAEGHKKGSENIRLLLEMAVKHDINYVTTYAFSSENWARTQEEINYLKNLIVEYLDNERDYFIKNKIKLLVIGDYTEFGEEISKKIRDLETETQNFDGVNLIIALNYGSKPEILRAVNNIISDVASNKLSLDSITEEIFSNYLYTKSIPDPDLLIRTGGEKRLSNFLLWQLAYTELYFEETMWPDFNEDCLNKAIETFYSRERRIGK